VLNIYELWRAVIIHCAGIMLWFDHRLMYIARGYCLTYCCNRWARLCGCARYNGVNHLSILARGRMTICSNARWLGAGGALTVLPFAQLFGCTRVLGF
jgi:hypothetical protein